MKAHVSTHRLLGAAVTDQCLLSFLENPEESNLSCYTIFIRSKYTRWYVSIINNARKRWQKKPKNVYTEKHHIIPKSLGGVNQAWNYAYLTPKEHYVCHRLLERAVVDEARNSMMIACFYMTHNQYWQKHNIETITFSARVYELARLAYHAKLVYYFETNPDRKAAIRMNKLLYWSDPANRQAQSARLKAIDAAKTDAYRAAEQQWLAKASQDYWSTVTPDEKQRIYAKRKKTAHNRGLVSYFDPTDYSKVGLYAIGSQPIGWTRGDPSLWRNGVPSKKTLERWAKHVSTT